MTRFGLFGLILFAIIIPGIIAGLVAISNVGVAIIVFAVLFFVLGILYLIFSIKVIIQYERGLLFRFGKYIELKGPGYNLIFPFLESIVITGLRIEVADAPPQEIITKDNIPLNINAVAYFRVADPEKAILEVANYRTATFQIAQTTIRSIVGQHEMDEVLIQREKINHKIKDIISEETEAWGIEIKLVELKDVELPNNLKRAMAKQAEAERERRARVILAQGELEASQKLAEAGAIVSAEGGAMQLRLLQTLQEISAEKNSTIVLPFPAELLSFLQNFSSKK